MHCIPSHSIAVCHVTFVGSRERWRSSSSAATCRSKRHDVAAPRIIRSGTPPPPSPVVTTTHCTNNRRRRASAASLSDRSDDDVANREGDAAVTHASPGGERHQEGSVTGVVIARARSATRPDPRREKTKKMRTTTRRGAEGSGPDRVSNHDAVVAAVRGTEQASRTTTQSLPPFGEPNRGGSRGGARARPHHPRGPDHVAFHSIPFRSAPFHSYSIAFHSVPIPSRSIPFHSIAFHSIPSR